MNWRRVEDNGGCVFVTAFSGLFGLVMRKEQYVRASGDTLSRRYKSHLIFCAVGYTQKGHIAQATLEATCYQTEAILDARVWRKTVDMLSLNSPLMEE